MVQGVGDSFLDCPGSPFLLLLAVWVLPVQPWLRWQRTGTGVLHLSQQHGGNCSQRSLAL